MPPPTHPCPACGSRDLAPHLDIGGYAIVRCAACGLEHVNPQPPAEAIHAHYQDLSYFEGQPDQGYLSYAGQHQALGPIFRRRLRRLNALLRQRAGRAPASPGARLLDFGCADGYFLSLAREDGWQVAGVEASAPMAARAAALTGLPIAADLAGLPEASADVVTLWEVVEHLPDPVGTLGALARCLAPGGLLMLSTPNTAHWKAKADPGAWEGYRPPSHLTFLSAATLADILRRAGLGVVEIRGTMPLPRLPGPVARLTERLRAALASGQARPWWLALWTWRLVRVGGLAWSRVAHRGDEVATTLEAVAVKPEVAAAETPIGATMSPA